MANRYTIHEIAKLLGISTDAIRLYEKEGLVTPVHDPQNGYRYYETLDIQRIMGIYLYRQLGVSLAEIKELLSATSLPEVADSFSTLIMNTESEIACLQKKLEKIRFMKQHLENLNQGFHTYRILELPDLYLLYHQDFSKPLYTNMKDILNSSIFSFGNFCYSLKMDETEHFQSQALQFAIREPMMKVCPWSDKRNSLPKVSGCRCLYTVTSTPIYSELCWDLVGLLAYAKESNLHCADYAYAFYIFSIIPEDTVMDFYEIYVPLL